MHQPSLSIAVLPFVNMSNSSEQEYFSDGITEEIINALTLLPSLRVTARTSSFGFKGKSMDITEIGKQLQVQALLEGSVRKAGAEVRITAQLIDASDGFHFWSEVYDRPWEDIFALQEEVALEIAHRMREHLGHMELTERLAVSPNNNLNAYQLYLQATFF